MKIRTIGCEHHRQLRNKLKGVAMEKLFNSFLGFYRNDVSIKKLLSLIKDNIKDYFIVKKPFKINDSIFETHDIINKKDLSKLFFIKGFGYLSVKDNKKTKWSKCSNCGQFIPTERLKYSRVKKCRKCFVGFFRKHNPEWTKGEPVTYFNKLINRLFSDGFISNAKALSRVDGFSYVDGVFTIFECKNKELTYLYKSDVASTLVYPSIILRCGYKIDEVRVVYNGDCSIKASRYNKSLKFTVVLKNILDLFDEFNFGVKSVVVKRTGRRYIYEIVDSDEYIIDLTSIDGPLSDKKLKEVIC